MGGPMCAIRFKNTEMSLAHYGVKGQKKGERRWQNEDGSLTPEGKIHYGVGDGNDRRLKIGSEEDQNDKANAYRKVNQHTAKNLLGDLATNLVGKYVRNSGRTMALLSSSSSMRTAGTLIAALGSVMVWGSRFKAVGDVGRHFMYQNAITNNWDDIQKERENNKA